MMRTQETSGTMLKADEPVTIKLMCSQLMGHLAHVQVLLRDPYYY